MDSSAKLSFVITYQQVVVFANRVLAILKGLWIEPIWGSDLWIMDFSNIFNGVVSTLKPLPFPSVPYECGNLEVTLKYGPVESSTLETLGLFVKAQKVFSIFKHLDVV